MSTCVIHVHDYDRENTKFSLTPCGAPAVATVAVFRNMPATPPATKPRRWGGNSYPADYAEPVGRLSIEPRCLEHLARDSDAFVPLPDDPAPDRSEQEGKD